MAVPAIIAKAGGYLVSFLQPISDILLKWKDTFLIWFAYKRGIVAGKKDARTDSLEEQLSNVDKIKRARNDADNRKRVRDKYFRD